MNKNEKIIWDFLIDKIKNPIGVAAIMGNLMAESSLSPVCATNLSKANISNVSLYVQASDSGEHDFVHDGIAFGIVQWCYYSRKQNLLDYARSKGKSVGDLMTQLEYLWKELQKYKTVYTGVINAIDLRKTTILVMLKYEKPGNTSEAAKNKRVNYAKRFLDEFATSTPQRTVMATSDVNLRAGKGTNTTKVGKIKSGTELEYISTEGGWHKVACWVSGDYTEVIS